MDSYQRSIEVAFDAVDKALREHDILLEEMRKEFLIELSLFRIRMRYLCF
jgi:hypothetical protein